MFQKFSFIFSGSNYAFCASLFAFQVCYGLPFPRPFPGRSNSTAASFQVVFWCRMRGCLWSPTLCSKSPKWLKLSAGPLPSRSKVKEAIGQLNEFLPKEKKVGKVKKFWSLIETDGHVICWLLPSHSRALWWENFHCMKVCSIQNGYGRLIRFLFCELPWEWE